MKDLKLRLALCEMSFDQETQERTKKIFVGEIMDTGLVSDSHSVALDVNRSLAGSPQG